MIANESTTVRGSTAERANVAIMHLTLVAVSFEARQETIGRERVWCKKATENQHNPLNAPQLLCWL
jgi:hypothetical protein